MNQNFDKVYLDLQRECLIEGTRIVSMGAWVYDLEQGKVHWSAGVYDVHGLEIDSEPPPFEECLSYYVAEDRDRMRGALARIQREGGSYDFECELITKAGVHKFVRVIGKSGSLLEGDQNCLYGVIQDISESRKIRDALVEAKDHANAANQAKSNFLATVSHELRTPLNPIMGFSDLLLEEIEDEEQLEMVRSINEAGQSLIETINRIIDFAELNPEKKKLSQDPIEVSSLVAEVASELMANVPSFSVETEMEQDPGLPEDFSLSGDLNKVKCVLSHLLENAAKFSGVQTVKLRTKLSSLDAEHAILHVDVEDVGVGIDAKLLERVFDPFLLGDSTFTRSKGGSGMGLAICRGYVELMDGQISVKSTVGEGATFSFYICLSMATKELITEDTSTTETEWGAEAIAAGVPAEEMTLESPVGASEEASASQAEPLSVLMVEDNLPNQFYQSRILKKMGYQVAMASNGREALEMYRPNLYDVVLLDLHMPGMDGIEVLRSIREGEARVAAEPVPVIVLTADLLKSTQVACTEYGANAFVSKPVDASELRRQIASVLSEGRSEVEF